MTDSPSASISAASCVRRRGDLASVEIDGETILYDPEAEMLHRLDPIATVVWGELDGDRPLSDVAADLAAAFETDEAVVLGDVMKLVQRLAADQLLVQDESAG